MHVAATTQASGRAGLGERRRRWLAASAERRRRSEATSEHHGARQRGQRQHGEEVLEDVDRHGQTSMAGGRDRCAIAVR